MEYGLNGTGFTPQKALSEKLKAMGVSSVDQLQGTTKTIWDIATLAPNTTATSVEFFNQNRGLNDTNFAQRFGVGEAMILQRINFFIARFAPDGSYVNAALLTNRDAYYYTVKIGNTTVLENFPIRGGLVAVGGIKGLATFSQAGNANSSFDLSSLLLLPPDTDFNVSLNNVFNNSQLNTERYYCVIEGTAVELNSKF